MGGTGEDKSTRVRPSRRRVLAALGSSVTVLTGCQGDESPPAATESRPPTDPTTAATVTTAASPSTAPLPTSSTTARTTTATPTQMPPVTPEPVNTWDEGGPPDRENWRVTFQDDFVGPGKAGNPAGADYPYTHEFE